MGRRSAPCAGRHPARAAPDPWALAELESALEGETILQLIERFETGRFATRDVLALIVAGLRGGGWSGTAGDLMTAEIEGGLLGCTQVAAQLLARAFAPSAA